MARRNPWCSECELAECVLALVPNSEVLVDPRGVNLWNQSHSDLI